MHDRLSVFSFFCLAPLVVALLLLGGCGSKMDDDNLVLAKVGDREVTAEYFKDRLARLREANLPRDDDGQVMDISSLEGKRAFLDVIIDKELMVAKAMQAGYLHDPRIAAARSQLEESYSTRHFWRANTIDPAQVTQAQIDRHYSRLEESRRCHYVITYTEAEAQAARQALLDGTPWSDVVASYHLLPTTEGKALEMSMTWALARERFRQVIFEMDVDDISEPIETPFGWWVVQVKEIEYGSKPDLDTALDQIRMTIARQESAYQRERILQETKKQRNFQINEEALRIVYDGLPEDEVLLDPQTMQPVPRDQLKPLQVPAPAYDMVLVTYDMSSGTETNTLVDYKAFFDRQNVFERPKKSAGLASLRSKLDQGIVEVIMFDEVRRRGYTEDPQVQKEVFAVLEEMLVDRVNEELVRYDENVSMEEIRSYYEENEEVFWRSEQREGTLIRARELEQAQEARLAWMDDALGEKPVRVPVGPILADPSRPLNVAIFDLEVGEYSEPFEMDDGWNVVRLDKIIAREKIELDPSRELIAQRIKSQRQERELRRLLDQWRDEFGVTVYDDRLAKMPSWEEAVAALGQ